MGLLLKHTILLITGFAVYNVGRLLWHMPGRLDQGAVDSPRPLLGVLCGPDHRSSVAGVHLVRSIPTCGRLVRPQASVFRLCHRRLRQPGKKILTPSKLFFIDKACLTFYLAYLYF